jgi:polyvinyl alcohol dehydrogenase (cytochrome)
VIDRTVRKLAIPALLAVCAGVLTIARAQSVVPIRAGAIGSSPATKAGLGADTPAAAARGGSGVPMQPDWVSSGQNNHNTRSAGAEHTINAGNVGDLKTAWIFTTAGDVSATATVVNGVAYVPDWGGKLWAIDTKTGKAIWSHDVSDYTAIR